MPEYTYDDVVQRVRKLIDEGWALWRNPKGFPERMSLEQAFHEFLVDEQKR